MKREKLGLSNESISKGRITTVKDEGTDEGLTLKTLAFQIVHGGSYQQLSSLSSCGSNSTFVNPFATRLSSQRPSSGKKKQK